MFRITQINILILHLLHVLGFNSPLPICDALVKTVLTLHAEILFVEKVQDCINGQ